ncbi:L,D-transpeptidase family protein [Streptomyces sp. 11x1]|uniref:L,D-transpeptidase n=1 Tax=Streptomyces sp. 11x1 TaxID=3038642 RepID=UPI002930F26F|nr:L,D-transpeptidase family protein [Streptomyces sp. 11x1]WNZ10072.1 murein L,D-transpeptidase [Streptomyces sp. 11x1]
MSDELTVRLRELAESAEHLPPGSGAEVRATAGRRRRRRRTTAAVAGGCAAAGLAAVLILNAVSHGTEQRPSATASIPPSATAEVAEVAEAADATVDLSRRVITVDGRELPISAGRPATPTPTGLMTVTAKADIKVVSYSTPGPGDESGEKLAWVLELSPVATGATGESNGGETTDGPAAGVTPDVTDVTPGTDGTDGTDRAAGTDATDGTDEAATADPTDRTDPSGPTDPSEPAAGTGAEKRTSDAPTRGPATGVLWIAALSADEKAPGNQDTNPGWIGLRTTDARWLYGRLTEGAIVEIRGTTSPPPSMAPTPSASPTFTSLG